MDNCLFCKIVKGEIPSYKIYEDDLVIAFLDIHPDTNGHTLIVPKKHILDIDDMDMITMNRILETAQKIKKRMEEVLKNEGLILIQNNGFVQEVKHFHLHLKPQYQEKQELKPVDQIYEILKITQD